MVRTIKQSNFDINHWITSNNTIFHLFLNTFFNCRNIFSWNYTTNNCIHKFITFTSFLWFNFNPNMTILTTTT